jgi:hypothetical protein
MLVVTERDNFIKSFHTLIPVAPQITPHTTHPDNMTTADVVKVISNPLEPTNFSYQNGIHFLTPSLQLVNLAWSVITM